MQIAKDTVVSMHYTLSDETGEIESSRNTAQPIEALIGHGGMIPGLENALMGHTTGDQVEVDVVPAEAYGERDEGQVQRVPKKYFRDGARLKPGVITALAMKDGGQRTVTVIKVGSSVVDVDLNHPLAGKTLHFAVEILAVREASAEEIAHRHVHGPGGVEH
ncbi:MAG TPA: peptidylprolyl isomerase [Dokdonella sp.]|uniref:FKBP-type peptidyl-prolyl cis-trans isomerase n=1 Tax=Dokdonella sp. TaxID=2291710 RepID=UPI002D7EC017|nr:peptidylprolyl isomerase [Dokdonella sp.]HET9032812.1 peptidylprolyl isomerase [Dokdonella sp.]